MQSLTSRLLKARYLTVKGNTTNSINVALQEQLALNNPVIIYYLRVACNSIIYCGIFTQSMIDKTIKGKAKTKIKYYKKGIALNIN
jgi:hypothetical protein